MQNLCQTKRVKQTYDIHSASVEAWVNNDHYLYCSLTGCWWKLDYCSEEGEEEGVLGGKEREEESYEC